MRNFQKNSIFEKKKTCGNFYFENSLLLYTIHTFSSCTATDPYTKHLIALEVEHKNNSIGLNHKSIMSQSETGNSFSKKLRKCLAQLCCGCCSKKQNTGELNQITTNFGNDDKSHQISYNQAPKENKQFKLENAAASNNTDAFERNIFPKRDYQTSAATQNISLSLNNTKLLATSYYADTGRRKQLLEEENPILVYAFLEENLERSPIANTIDLHYLHVKEAIEALDRFIDNEIILLRTQNATTSVYVIVITGRGKHSKGGIPKIKPAVIIRLAERNLEYFFLLSL